MTNQNNNKKVFQGYKPDENLKEKVCNITGKRLPIKEFWKDRWMKDGYTNYSKEGYKLRWINKDPKYVSKRKYNGMNRK